MIREECFICGSEGSYGNLPRHYIDWNSSNNDPDNLVTLCEGCHFIIHEIGYVSKEEMLELRKKLPRYGNAPIALRRSSFSLVYHMLGFLSALWRYLYRR
jgi:hypothetical protein